VQAPTPVPAVAAHARRPQAAAAPAAPRTDRVVREQGPGQRALAHPVPAHPVPAPPGRAVRPGAQPGRVDPHQPAALVAPAQPEAVGAVGADRRPRRRVRVGVVPAPARPAVAAGVPEWPAVAVGVAAAQGVAAVGAARHQLAAVGAARRQPAALRPPQVATAAPSSKVQPPRPRHSASSWRRVVLICRSAKAACSSPSGRTEPLSKCPWRARVTDTPSWKRQHSGERLRQRVALLRTLPNRPFLPLPPAARRLPIRDHELRQHLYSKLPLSGGHDDSASAIITTWTATRCAAGWPSTPMPCHSLKLGAC
jgi:hypothetical protein